MDESTRTEPTDDTSAQDAQLESQTVDTTAENQPAESNEDTNQDSQEAAPTDDNLAWLQNKGVDPTSPEALSKVAEMYRNAEKQMHQSTEAKAQLQQALQQPVQQAYVNEDGDVVTQLQQQVQAMQMKQSVRDFWEQNPDAKAYESKMTELVTSNPNMAQLVQAGYLGLDNLYQMAKGSDPNRETTLKTEGGREALQKVADKQQARAVTGNATSSAMSNGAVTKQNFDSWYAGLSATERAKPENQEIVASLLSS